MKLSNKIQKIPGGTMLVPMAIGALVNTFIPSIYEIGNPLSAVLSSNGTMCIVGLMLVFSGIQTKPKQLLMSFKRCGLLIIIKLILNIIIGISFVNVFGLSGIYGISALSFVAALTSCNPGVYMALMENLGDEIDKAGFAFLNLVGLPFVPICILGFAGNNGIDYMSIIATLIPFILGMVLALVDTDIRSFTKSGSTLLLPFLGFCLGSSIDLNMTLSKWSQGLILFVVVLLINIVPLLIVDKKILHQKGYCAAAICCVAGLAITVPGLMAEADASYLPYVETAQAQIAFAVIVSAIVTPILTKN